MPSLLPVDRPTQIAVDATRDERSLRRPSIHRFDLDGTQLPSLAERCDTDPRLMVPRLDLRWTSGDWNPADDRNATTAWTCFVVGGSACYHRR